MSAFGEAGASSIIFNTSCAVMHGGQPEMFALVEARGVSKAFSSFMMNECAGILKPMLSPLTPLPSAFATTVSGPGQNFVAIRSSLASGISPALTAVAMSGASICSRLSCGRFLIA